MDNKFCSNCGGRLKEGALFCHVCGKSVGSDYGANPVGNSVHGGVYRYEYRPKCGHLPFSCILAYIPGLFWLPLITGFKDDRHRDCANQGLWLTITFFLYGAIIYFGGCALFQKGLIDIDSIINLFRGWDSYDWTEKLPTIIGLQVAAAFALYAPVNGICGFFHGFCSGNPYILPILGHIRLIRRRKCDAERSGETL